jgi:hypothetical protein
VLSDVCATAVIGTKSNKAKNNERIIAEIMGAFRKFYEMPSYETLGLRPLL